MHAVAGRRGPLARRLERVTALVPLLLTGVRLHPPGRTDKNLCRCFGAPARRVSPDHLITRTTVGLVESVPITRFCAEEHRARVDGRATARHLHGNIERAVRCVTVKVSAESAGSVASTMFFGSLHDNPTKSPTRTT